MIALRLLRAASALAVCASPLLSQTSASVASVPVTISGELRSRGEWDRPGGAPRADLYSYLRARLGVRVDIATNARIVLQAQDSRVYGAESNNTVSNPDVFDLHQAYVELEADWKWARSHLTARVGRQEIALGNERLIGAVNWSNTGRAFDGARFTVAQPGVKAGKEQWSVNVFAATVDERGRHFGPLTTPADTQPDHSVIGTYITRSVGTSLLDFTLFRDARSKYRRYSASNRATADARFRTAQSRPIAIELEGAIQRGTQQFRLTSGATAIEQTIGAWLASLRVTRPSDSTRRMSGSVGVDALSGDADAQDATYGAFNTMYATNHGYYGLLDIFPDPTGQLVDRGFLDAFATVAFVLDPRATARAELHRFAALAGNRNALGWEIDVVLPVRLTKNTALEIGEASFRAASAATAVGLGATGVWKHWAYLQLRAGF